MSKTEIQKRLKEIDQLIANLLEEKEMLEKKSKEPFVTNGWAVKFQETAETEMHLDVLDKNGMVLWGQWKAPGSRSNFSKATKNAMNENGAYLYAIGQNSVWKMHVKKVLDTEEVKDNHYEHLIPEYYSTDKEVYCWYLIDEIEKEGMTVLSDMYRPNGRDYTEGVYQVSGARPWRVCVG